MNYLKPISAVSMANIIKILNWLLWWYSQNVKWALINVCSPGNILQLCRLFRLPPPAGTPQHFSGNEAGAANCARLAEHCSDKLFWDWVTFWS